MQNITGIACCSCESMLFLTSPTLFADWSKRAFVMALKYTGKVDCAGSYVPGTMSSIMSFRRKFG